METVDQIGVRFAHQVGKLDTDFINGLLFAHQEKIVGKLDTVLKNGLEFAHLQLMVGKLDTDF